MNQRLKIGIAVNNSTLNNWQLKAITNLIALDLVVIDLINLPESAQNKKRLFFPVIYLIKKLKWIVQKIEEFLFSEIGPNAFTKMSINDDMGVGRPILFDDTQRAINYIKKEKHDVILNFSSYLLPDTFINITRFGLWQVFTGKTAFSNVFIGLSEVFGRETTHVVSLLQIQESSKKNKILCQSFSQVDKINLLRNNNNAFWKAPYLISRRIQEIVDSETVLEDLEKVSSTKIEKPSLSNEISLLRFFFLVPFRYFQFFFNQIKKRFVFNQWILMYQFDNGFNNDISFKDYVKIIPPNDRIWADPFVIKKKNKYHVYIEELELKDGKGYISHFTIDNEGSFTKPKKIIENKYHMSYPFLIEDNGTLYMIPETNQNRTIEIYKCVEFPLKWELEQVLVENIDAVDATIFFQNGKYWMFAGVREQEGIAYEDELFVYSSDSLLSQNWVRHPKSPVVSDVRIARPAGNLFRYGNSVIRPSQNSENHYGFGLNFLKIAQLDEGDYEEKIEKVIVPDWDESIVSIHTYNHTDGLTIVDAEKKTWRL